MVEDIEIKRIKFFKWRCSTWL